MRRSLELEALAEITAAPDPERLAELARSMAACEHGPHFSDITKFSRLDHSFHWEFVAATGNRFLLRSWEGLHFHLRVHRVYAGEGVTDFTEANSEHAAIVAAASQDLDALRAAVERHIDTAARRITRLSADSTDAASPHWHIPVVEISTSDGLTGTGYSGVWAGDDLLCLTIDRYLTPMLLGQDATAIGALWNEMYWSPPAPPHWRWPALAAAGCPRCLLPVWWNALRAGRSSMGRYPRITR